MINQGLNEESASTVVSNLKEQEHKEKQNVANKEMLYGFLWALGGIVLTVATDGAYIFYGAVLYGGWLILKGIGYKIE